MAENDQDNEEYRFSELDTMEDLSASDSTDVQEESTPTPERPAAPEAVDVRRRALIVIGSVLLLFGLYKIGGNFFSKSTPPVTPTNTAPTAQVAPKPIEEAPKPIQPMVTDNTSELKQKVSDIEMKEQGISTDVTSVKDQVSAMSNNITNLNTEIAKLNQVINELSNQVTKQSSVITMLIARAQAKKPKPTTRYAEVDHILYYIKAVIPGRAWLIGSNGSTLTVRAGTKIQGYGVVRLIDSIQGRVLTSSGKVIKFSQNDS